MPSIVIEEDGTIDMRFTDDPVCKCCNSSMLEMTPEVREEEEWEGFMWPKNTKRYCGQCQLVVLEGEPAHHQRYVEFFSKGGVNQAELRD